MSYQKWTKRRGAVKDPARRTELQTNLIAKRGKVIRAGGGSKRGKNRISDVGGENVDNAKGGRPWETTGTF